jgi:hypothetical protein
MNVEIGAEAALFPEKEYINGIAVAGQCTCVSAIQQRSTFSKLYNALGKIVCNKVDT